jgi:hypothetical protein
MAVTNSDSALALVNKVDQVKAFMLFAYFGGDTVKTAQACAVDVRLIESLAHDFNWLGQIKGQNRLDTDEGRKAEQEANRARNYVMAVRLGNLLEHITLKASQNPEQWADVNCIDVDPVTGEKTFDSKPLVEIAKAAQIISDMTYRATGDKMAATASTTTASDGAVTNLMINVYSGLDKLEKTAKKLATQMSPDDPTAPLEAVVVPKA